MKKDCPTFVLSVKNIKYPSLLKEIPDPPAILFVRGKKGRYPINLKKTIAVVGSRNMSLYGKTTTVTIVSALVSHGYTIVSGMARGIDAVAHETALSQGGQTVAVLGCGVDVIAPLSNEWLYWSIIESGRGAIISEVPDGLRPAKASFVRRNRIISGLSLGVVVIEGTDQSGTLITARFAAEQGREVFAIPGPITSKTSKGPSRLLKSGAKLVESVGDILEELSL